MDLTIVVSISIVSVTILIGWLTWLRYNLPPLFQDDQQLPEEFGPIASVKDTIENVPVDLPEPKTAKERFSRNNPHLGNGGTFSSAVGFRR